MSLTAHQLALRLARQIGVSSFDPLDPSNSPIPPAVASLQGGDLDYIVACVNGAMQELWPFAPNSSSDAPSITVADVGIMADPGTRFPLPEGWEESVLLPLALQRMTVHPEFKPASGKGEIERQTAVARSLLQRLSTQVVPVLAVELAPTFR